MEENTRYHVMITHGNDNNPLTMPKIEDYVCLSKLGDHYLFLDVTTSLIKLCHNKRIVSYKYIGKMMPSGRTLPNSSSLLPFNPVQPQGAAPTSFGTKVSALFGSKPGTGTGSGSGTGTGTAPVQTGGIPTINDIFAVVDQQTKEKEIEVIKSMEHGHDFKSPLTIPDIKVAIANEVRYAFGRTGDELQTHLGKARAYVRLLFLQSPTKTTYTDEEKYNNLIMQQWQNCEMAYNDLRQNKKKTKHWAWWAFPTTKEGKSERVRPSKAPNEKITSTVTGVKDRRDEVIEYAPPEFRFTLDILVKLLEEEKGRGTAAMAVLEKILPIEEDRGRLKHFVEFWEGYNTQDKDEKGFYTWLPPVRLKLQEYTG